MRYSYGITSALLSGVAALCLLTSLPAGAQEAQHEQLRGSSRAVPVAGAPASFAELTTTLMPAVVNISARQSVPVTEDPRPNGPRVEAVALGSGFLISADGYLVTNNHVVHPDPRARLLTLSVTLADGTEYDAELVGQDEASDLAVLKITRPRAFPFVAFGDSDRAHVGDWVVAIGNPFGLDGTVTSGIISALNRSTGSRGAFDRSIQTDASINSGNSGGPLFDMAGRVIGINRFILSPSGGNIGIGMAIPASDAEPIVRQLISGEPIQRGFIGVQIDAVDEDFAEALGIAENSGEFIQSVQPGQPAAAAGLQAADVVTSVNDEDITRDRSLSYIVSNIRPGTRVPLVYVRDGQERRTTVTVGRRPSEDDLRAGQPETFDPAQEGADQLEPGQGRGASEVVMGLRVSAITPIIARGLGAGPEMAGVVVLAVDPTADAARKGLVRGFVIHAANGKPVSTPEELEAVVIAAMAADRDAVLLRISARGQPERSVPVRLRSPG